MSEGVAELEAIAERVAAQAGAGEQVEAVVVRSRDTEIRVYEGAVEKLSSAEAQGIGVRVIVDSRQGFAYAGSLDADAIDEALAEARDNAAFATSDEYLGLAEPDGVPLPELDLYRPELATVPTERKIELATELERAVLAADPRITAVEHADYNDAVLEAAVASSTGVRASSRETGAYVSAYVLASDGGETQTGFGFSVGREPGELDVGEAAADAVRRATRMLGATKPASERLTVILDPFVTAQFLSIIGGTLSGDAVLKGRSLFTDRVGEQVAAPIITFVDDPTDARAYTASQSDGEGLATRRNVLLDAGVLKGFVHNTYTGRRLGTASTGSAVRGGFRSAPGVGCRAMSLVPGTDDQATLVTSVGDGLLVQSVSGLHSGVNPVSGDFSTGAEGIRIRGGELAEPVREFTIASTLQRMLHDVVAVGGDVEWLPMSAIGVSLVINDVTMSGA